MEISEKSSSAEMSNPEAIEEKAEPMVATDDFNTMLASVNIADFSLFGGPE